MNVAIIGSREFNDYKLLEKSILEIIVNNNIDITKIISGGARGADKLSEIYANKYKIPIEIILPDWSIGKSAGFIRNSDIINKCDIVIAFWNGISKGTLDSIKKAKKLNKTVFIINF